jgi:hypothetical protein
MYTESQIYTKQFLFVDGPQNVLQNHHAFFISTKADSK